MKLFCTERAVGDLMVVGPDILAEDWPSAEREAAERGLTILGQLVSEDHGGTEVSAADVIEAVLNKETKH